MSARIRARCPRSLAWGDEGQLLRKVAGPWTEFMLGASRLECAGSEPPWNTGSPGVSLATWLFLGTFEPQKRACTSGKPALFEDLGEGMCLGLVRPGVSSLSPLKNKGPEPGGCLSLSPIQLR